MDITSLLFTAAAQASAWGEIRLYFLERPLDTDSPMFWFIAFVIMTLLLAALIIVLIIRARRRSYIPTDWLVKPQEIKNTLQLAIDQRARFDLQFKTGKEDDEEKTATLRCTGVRVENTILVLEVSGLQQLSRHWVGMTAECFFLLSERARTECHAFLTTVKDVNIVKGFCYLYLHLPQKIEARQKRAYLRIMPPEEFMLGAALWSGEDLPDDTARDSLREWRKPSFFFLPGNSEQFSVRDISAGGARLALHQNSLTADHEDLFKINERLIMMLDLWEPEKAMRLRFWMLCRIRAKMLDYETSSIDLGVQFLSWAKPREKDESNEIEWLRLSGTGEVEMLGNWIIRRHLELFREKENFFQY